MKVCYLGDYNLGYPRHKVLIRGMNSNNIEVIEKNTQKVGFEKYLDLIKFTLEANKESDIILIGYSDSRFVPLVKLFSSKPVIWNAFYSKYENWIFDRRLAMPISLKACYYWFTDWLCCIASDLIILEADADIDYFVKTFKIKKSKFLKIFVGWDEDVFYPQEYKKISNDFIVEFHGKYIPIQGIEYIVEAAKILENNTDIRFNLVGSGQEYKKIRKMAECLNIKNIFFTPKVPLEDVPKYIAEADVCLGLFGNIERTEQAIPNKVYEASAMGKPSINANTKAVHELFVDRESILLCKKGDAEDLAKKILEIKEDDNLRKKIAQNAYGVVSKQASTKELGRVLKNRLISFLADKH